VNHCHKPSENEQSVSYLIGYWRLNFNPTPTDETWRRLYSVRTAGVAKDHGLTAFMSTDKWASVRSHRNRRMLNKQNHIMCISSHFLILYSLVSAAVRRSR